jgi:hypothetical protein
MLSFWRARALLCDGQRDWPRSVAERPPHHDLWYAGKNPRRKGLRQKKG